MFASALPHCERNFVGLPFDQPDVHIDMANVFVERAAGALDGDEARLDSDLNALRDVEFFSLMDVPHLERNRVSYRKVMHHNL